jgi:hypothetical protein
LSPAVALPQIPFPADKENSKGSITKLFRFRIIVCLERKLEEEEKRVENNNLTMAKIEEADASWSCRKRGQFDPEQAVPI